VLRASTACRLSRHFRQPTSVNEATRLHQCGFSAAPVIGANASNAHPENKFFCGTECQGGLKSATHVA
jgi:hypothetical protein